MDMIQELIEKEINQNSIAGASVLAFKKDRVVYKNSFGYSDAAAHKMLKSDTIMRLFSLSKPITSAAIMILLERQCISLTDPVSKYLPAFQGQKVVDGEQIVAAKREVTIADLLSMTSGEVYPEDSVAGRQVGAVFDEQVKSIQGGIGIPTVEFINRLAECPLGFQPGKQWQYGTSADILAAVAEVVSGMRYGDFLKEELFEPLGMEDTDFYVPKEKQDRLSEWYDYDYEKKSIVPYRGTNLAVFDYTRRPAWESGGAGLVSTIDDYGKFARMLLQEGEFEGKRILSPEMVHFMRTNQLTNEQRRTYTWDSTKGYGYGNLVRILEDPKQTDRIAAVGSYGWDGWTGPLLLLDPVNELVYLFFVQKVNAGTTPLSLEVNNQVYKML